VTSLPRLAAVWAFGLGAAGCAAAPVGGEEVGGIESESSSSSESESTTTGDSTTDSESSTEESTDTGSTSSESDTSETGEPLIVEVSTLAYGDDPAQVLDLYLPVPAAADPVPTLVLAHGGLWQSGSRLDLANLCESIVLGSGGTQACASIDYRLSQDLGGNCMAGPDAYRGQLGDFAAAFVLLQNDAEVHGLDAARMFVGGHSAGGHLAHTLNLRWAEFEGICTRDECPPAIGAIGIEGIYDIATWDAYDQVFWNGSFNCATRKAFGDSPSSPQPCIDAELGRPCWEAGSPTYLAQHAAELAISPVGNALMIHSPGDDWVDIAEASTLGAALESAFPEITVITSIDGTCATGGHAELLSGTELTSCLLNFVASNGTMI
jgi:hypothetical protein